MMRGARSSAASATIVVRETPTVSVPPTVSEVILTLSRRNSEVTRDSNPVLSSTSATKVCNMKYQLLKFRCCFYQRIMCRATDHFMQRRAGGNHWIDGIFLL